MTTPGAIVAEPVSLRDLPATVLDLVSPKHDPGPFPGRSLARFAGFAGPAPPQTLAELPTLAPIPGPVDGDVVLTSVALRDKVSRNAGRPPALRGPMKSVVAEGHVYIRNSDDREELFDLAADPAEATDLAGRGDLKGTLERLRNLADQVHPEGRP